MAITNSCPTSIACRWLVLPAAQVCLRKIRKYFLEITKERQKKAAPSPPLPQRPRRRAWWGTALGALLSGLLPTLLFPLPPLPPLLLRCLTPCVFLSRGWDLSPCICGGEEIQNRLAAPRIGEAVPDLKLCLLREGQFLTYSHICVLYGHHQHLAVGLVPCPFRYWQVRQ